MDKIIIKRIEVYAFHGVYSEENRLGQKFYVSAELILDTRPAARGDDLDRSVNYGEVTELIVRFMQQNQFKLLETTANKLAEAILTAYPMVQKTVIDLEKPNAPIPYPLETVVLHIERARHIAYLGLGSNLGERADYINTAIALLDADPLTEVLKRSPFYETAPYGYTDQPAFINSCLEISTLYSPEELLSLCNEIEYRLGRTREIHWGPRTVDIDILLYDNEIIDTDILHIPHIDMANRLFVLKPLSDIAPYLRHPYLNQTIGQLLEKLENK